MNQSADNLTVTDIPLPRRPNDLIRQHGPAGWLVIRLQRYAVMGWLAFITLAIVFVLFVFVDRLTPQPVLAVDEGGRLLGQFDYLNPDERTDPELIAGTLFFIDRYLSVNSATVYNDYAAALNMMSESLRDAKVSEVKSSGYLSQIEHAGSHSYLEFYDGERAPSVLWRRDLQSAVRVQGKMVIVMNDTAVERPFDITLELTTVARNRLSTQGIKVDVIRNN